MSYIEEYYEWIKANPKKVNKKVTIVYKKLVENIKEPKTVSFFNKLYRITYESFIIFIF